MVRWLVDSATQPVPQALPPDQEGIYLTYSLYASYATPSDPLELVHIEIVAVVVVVVVGAVEEAEPLGRDQPRRSH